MSDKVSESPFSYKEVQRFEGYSQSQFDQLPFGAIKLDFQKVRFLSTTATTPNSPASIQKG